MRSLNRAQKYRSAAESGEIGKKHQQLRLVFTIWRMEIEAGERRLGEGRAR